MLPEIAAFFGVTIDELFDIHGEKSPENAIKELNKLQKEKRWRDLAEKAFEYIRLFPYNSEFIPHLLVAVSQTMLIKERLSEKLINQAINFGKRALCEHTNELIKQDITYNLCIILYQAGRNEEADFYCELLSPAAMCRETLAVYKFHGEKQRAELRKNIAMYHTLLGASFWQIAYGLEASESSVSYLRKAIESHTAAYEYDKSKRNKEIILLLKFDIVITYLLIGESEKAEKSLREADIFSKENSLEETFARLIKRMISNEKIDANAKEFIKQYLN